jgi:NADPH-dependent 2,4-dienoyl-CoA reductase/sulfur reductase-like enzyme
MLRTVLRGKKSAFKLRSLSSVAPVPKQVGLNRTYSVFVHDSRCTSGVCLQARVVVVGGGIIGNSVAYHLAKMGMKDVVLLEQQQVTAGTTWHAAGLMVTFGSMSETSTDMRKYTKKLYSELEAETGQATGFKPVGKTHNCASLYRIDWKVEVLS